MGKDTIAKIIGILNKSNIMENVDSINGLNKDITNKWCIEISEGSKGKIYKVYYIDQYSSKQYEKEYQNEDEAIIKYLKEYQLFSGMTMTEMLYTSGYMDKYEKLERTNKTEAQKLLGYFINNSIVEIRLEDR